MSAIQLPLQLNSSSRRPGLGIESLSLALYPVNRIASLRESQGMNRSGPAKFSSASRRRLSSQSDLNSLVNMGGETVWSDSRIFLISAVSKLNEIGSARRSLLPRPVYRRNQSSSAS